MQLLCSRLLRVSLLDLEDAVTSRRLNPVQRFVSSRAVIQRVVKRLRGARTHKLMVCMQVEAWRYEQDHENNVWQAVIRTDTNSRTLDGYPYAFRILKQRHKCHALPDSSDYRIRKVVHAVRRIKIRIFFSFAVHSVRWYELAATGFIYRCVTNL
jgi:hypothetical protein